MRRATVNFIIDVVAFVGFVLLTVTGILMHYILPPGSGSYASLWGLNRHDWGELHFWVSAVFFSVLSVHLILHWRWIVCIVKGKASDRSGLRLGLGLLGLLVIIAFSLTPFIAKVEYKTSQGHSLHSGKWKKGL